MLFPSSKDSDRRLIHGCFAFISKTGLLVSLSYFWCIFRTRSICISTPPSGATRQTGESVKRFDLRTLCTSSPSVVVRFSMSFDMVSLFSSSALSS